MNRGTAFILKPKAAVNCRFGFTSIGPFETRPLASHARRFERPPDRYRCQGPGHPGYGRW